MTRSARIRFHPHSCVVCGKVHEPIVLDAEKYYRWESGESIQSVFPEMSPDEREILISGTCPECWNVLFPEEDEEVELEDSDPDESLTEEMQRDKIDRMNAAVEVERAREEYKWDQLELKQRAEAVEAMEKEDEERRLRELEEWHEAVEEQNDFYCTDPFCPNFGNVFS